MYWCMVPDDLRASIANPWLLLSCAFLIGKPPFFKVDISFVIIPRNREGPSSLQTVTYVYNFTSLKDVSALIMQLTFNSVVPFSLILGKKRSNPPVGGISIPSTVTSHEIPDEVGNFLRASQSLRNETNPGASLQPHNELLLNVHHAGQEKRWILSDEDGGLKYYYQVADSSSRSTRPVVRRPAIPRWQKKHQKEKRNPSVTFM